MQNLTPYIMLVEAAKAAVQKIGSALKDRLLDPLEAEFAALAHLLAAGRAIVDDILLQAGLQYERKDRLTDSRPEYVAKLFCDLVDAIQRTIISWNLAVADLPPGARPAGSGACLAAARVLAGDGGIVDLEYQIDRLRQMYRELHAPAGPKPNPIATTGISKGEVAILLDLAAIKRHFGIE